MSIILKGIDMPSRIDLDFHDNHIVLGGVLYPIDIDQLVYIPTPHGRLIEEHYPGELQAKQPEGLFVMYRSADKDTDRFILEAEE